MNTLKEIRIEKKLTQKQVANIMGISIRSYKSYENDDNKTDSIKYKYMLNRLKEINPIDETHGILEIDDIKKTVFSILKKYDVNYCYLFGSYAKGSATETSDIDFLISTDITGIKYFELIEELRNSLHKKIDALDINQLNENFDLVQEILKDGIKIYG